MPTSDKQIEANRRNAQHSTGPRTPEGKARSAMNGFHNSSLAGLTAIMTDEDRLNQNAFVKEYMADLEPVGAVEVQLARTIALDNWRLTRYKAIEENIFAWGHEVSPGIRVDSEIDKVVNAFTHANSFLKYSSEFEKISRCEARLNRNIARNLDLLLERQAARRKRTPAPIAEPIAESPSIQPLTFRNGFASAAFSSASASASEEVETGRKAA